LWRSGWIYSERAIIERLRIIMIKTSNSTGYCWQINQSIKRFITFFFPCLHELDGLTHSNSMLWSKLLHRVLRPDALSATHPPNDSSIDGLSPVFLKWHHHSPTKWSQQWRDCRVSLTPIPGCIDNCTM